MDLQEISTLITKTAKAIEANEKVALPIVAAKARREAQNKPTDVPLINASNVLTKMANDRTFISKEELRGILERFNASHSKLSAVFSEELNRQASAPKLFSRDPNEGTPLEKDFSKFADPLLSNALSGVFSNEEKLYTTADAQRAQRAVHARLLGIGVNTKDIKTFAGRNDIIICQAVHETPKGLAHILVPVEFKEGKAILPTVFFSTAGFEDLKKEAYIAQMKMVAGKSFRVDGAKLLDILEQVKRGNDGINEVELAAIKVASENGSPALDTNSILYTELENPQKDVQLPKLAETKESKFAETLGKPDGVARFVHGDKVVEAGREMLVRKFAEIGYRNVQVKVADVEQDKIFYAVAIGTGTGLKVPVEVTGNLVIPPKVVFGDSEVTAFSKEAIDGIVKAVSGGNKRALATASKCYDMKPSELMEVVKESVAEGNYLRAEDAINVLGEVDPGAQQIAITHMMMSLGEAGKTEGFAELKRIASQPIKDTPQFMTHKIFFPEGA